MKSNTMSRWLSPLVLASALAFGGVANAQSEQQGQSGQMGQQGQQQGSKMTGMQQAGQGQQITIAGKILKKKDVDVQGEQPNTVALILTQNNERVVADLGPSKALQQNQNQLAEGRQLQVTGTPGRVADRLVLFAKSLQLANGQQHDVTRSQTEMQAWQQAQQGGAQQQPSMQGQQMFTGEILARKDVKLGESDQRNTVVLVKTEQDEGRVVDLGPTKELRGFRLSRGTKIEGQGQLASVGDQLVIVARQASIDDRSLDLSQRQMPGQQGHQGQGQQQ